MRVKVVYDTDEGRELLVTMKCIPRVGEKVLLDEAAPAEVVAVMYTPWSDEHEAVLTVQKGKL